MLFDLPVSQPLLIAAAVAVIAAGVMAFRIRHHRRSFGHHFTGVGTLEYLELTGEQAADFFDNSHAVIPSRQELMFMASQDETDTRPWARVRYISQGNGGEQVHTARVALNKTDWDSKTLSFIYHLELLEELA